MKTLESYKIHIYSLIHRLPNKGMHPTADTLLLM